ncbi:MAG: pyruvate formate lyase-activating protein [Oscillospiraceae bacterium]|nr:pyruvate formate lyase-activating protein [Candidatus Equicaccousia limihippi]
MDGVIHSIQSLGAVDGPGVRCVVFMQGCPLRCICCHNPDTWEISGGTPISTDELVKKILRFKNYFGEKGGVTVSGGEPLLQADFVCELFTKLKDCGIHTALDTSGFVMNKSVQKLLSVTDLCLLDYKYETDEEYQKYVGTSLLNVERFLGELENQKVATWLRRVIIPQKTDGENGIKSLVRTAQKYSCVQKIELLPFQNFCKEKYENLKIDFLLKDTKAPSQEIMEKLWANIPQIYR